MRRAVDLRLPRGMGKDAEGAPCAVGKRPGRRYGRGRPVGGPQLDDFRVDAGHFIHGHLGVCSHYVSLGGFWSYLGFDFVVFGSGLGGAVNLGHVCGRPVKGARLDF